MENTKEKPRKNSLGFSEGILIAFVPAAVYALGFSFESGYLSYYGVPSSLASIDIPALISASLLGAFYIFVLLMWLTLSIDLTLDKSNIVKIVGVLMLYLGFLPVLYFILKGAEYLVYVLLACFTIIIVILLLSILEKKHEWLSVVGKKIHDGVRKLLPGEEKNSRSGAVDALTKAGVVVFLSLIPFAIAYSAGKHYAKDKTNYGVVKHNRLGELAVVRIYGGSLIAIPFNREKKSLSNKYIVADVNNDKYMPIHHEEIGPLLKYRHSNPNKRPE